MGVLLRRGAVESSSMHRAGVPLELDADIPGHPQTPCTTHLALYSSALSAFEASTVWPVPREALAHARRCFVRRKGACVLCCMYFWPSSSLARPLLGASNSPGSFLCAPIS